MNVIICCEESQAICIEFRLLGHGAFSCDLQNCSGGHPEWHFTGDCFEILKCGKLTLESGEVVEIEKWDLLIGHPPCTYLSNVGEQWFDINKHYLKALERWDERFSAVLFFFRLLHEGKKIGKVCLENPKGYINRILKPTQTIEPYYFGDEDKKLTHLWLYGLDNLYHSKNENLFGEKTWTKKPEPIYTFVGKNGKSKRAFFTDAISGGKENSQRLRSKTFKGIANAIARQWG